MDVGSKTIGMAVCDELGMLARGLETLRRKSERVDLEKIGDVLRRYQIAEIVVGHPVRLGGEASAQTGKVAAFAGALRARFGLPVRLWDERLTSVQAEELLGKRRSLKRRIEDRKSGAVDRMAAILILQSYLNAHTATAFTGRVRPLAEQYTAAWCSQDPAGVAACYSAEGSLSINGGPPAIGRAAIAQVAAEFMAAFPDLRVQMDDLAAQTDGFVYRWTLDGTNTGPGGAGNRVRISGYEEWRIGADGLIAESRGHFDAAEYQRQLAGGSGESR